jgi:hypothetical protein
MQTTKSGHSPRGLRGRGRGQVRASNERSGYVEVDKITGLERCSSVFGSPPSGGDSDSPTLAARWVRPGRCEMMRR